MRRRRMLGLALCGCTLGCHDLVADQPAGNQGPTLQLDSPRLSPDGAVMLLSFKYGDLPWKLAVIALDPMPPRLRILEAPPTMNWLRPNWAPDGETFVAVSFCEGAQCYGGAQGYHVWRFTPRPNTGGLERLTPDGGEIRRDYPFFGLHSDDVFWTYSSNHRFAGVRGDSAYRGLARGAHGTERLVFPEDARVIGANLVASDQMPMMVLEPAAAFDGQRLYFVAVVPGGSLPAARTASRLERSYERRLFRYENGVVELLRATQITAVAASRRPGGDHAVVFHTRPFGNSPSEFEVMRGDTVEQRLRFDRGGVGSLSASDSLDTLAFWGQRSFGGEGTIWLHRKGMPAPLDLGIPERLRAELATRISQERTG